jgi:hypothetical protein
MDKEILECASTNSKISSTKHGKKMCELGSLKCQGNRFSNTVPFKEHNVVFDTLNFPISDKPYLHIEQNY